MYKQCPRCGGDVDASFSEDVHCVQCGDRPVVVYPGPVILGAGDQSAILDPADPVLGNEFGGVEAEAAQAASAVAVAGMREVCPRCGAGESMVLEKVRPEYNTCFRCRKCSHVYSP